MTAGSGSRKGKVPTAYFENLYFQRCFQVMRPGTVVLAGDLLLDGRSCCSLSCVQRGQGLSLCHRARQSLASSALRKARDAQHFTPC